MLCWVYMQFLERTDNGHKNKSKRKRMADIIDNIKKRGYDFIG